MIKIGIIGYGVVGKAVGRGFSTKYNVVYNDPNIEDSIDLPVLAKSSDFIFICVPTPTYTDGRGIDLTIINSVIKKLSELILNTDKIIIIKSSTIPGTVETLISDNPGLNICMSPEFLTELNSDADFINQDRIVVGSLNEDTAIKVVKLYKSVINSDARVFITTPTTAEFVKFMSNTFMATKVIYANEMAELAGKLDINYDQAKDMVGADRRILPTFLSVTPFGGFGGKCFPKDTLSLLALGKKYDVDLSILRAAWNKNLKLRKVRDWEGIAGAISEVN